MRLGEEIYLIMASFSNISPSGSKDSSSVDPAGPPEKHARVGAVSPMLVQCIRCLHTLADADASFCSKCGNSLGSQTAYVDVQIKGIPNGPGRLKSTEEMKKQGWCYRARQTRGPTSGGGSGGSEMET